MSDYSVTVASRASKSIARLPLKEQRRVNTALDLLAEEPRPVGCVALSGEESVYRLRVGNYRILYEVFDAVLVVQVVRVGHRRDIYRSR